MLDDTRLFALCLSLPLLASLAAHSRGSMWGELVDARVAVQRWPTVNLRPGQRAEGSELGCVLQVSVVVCCGSQDAEPSAWWRSRGGAF